MERSNPPKWCFLIELIEFNKLIFIPHCVQKLDKIGIADDDGAGVVVGMETQPWGVSQVLVDEKVHLVVLVVDEAERGDAARFQAEVFLHASLRGEGELTLVQPLLKVVDVHLVHALEDDEIVLVALVVPEKQVLAMRRLELAPIGQRLLDGAQRRVKLDVELNAEADKRIDDFLLPFAQWMVNF